MSDRCCSSFSSDRFQIPDCVKSRLDIKLSYQRNQRSNVPSTAIISSFCDFGLQEIFFPAMGCKMHVESVVFGAESFSSFLVPANPF